MSFLLENSCQNTITFPLMILRYIQVTSKIVLIWIQIYIQVQSTINSEPGAKVLLEEFIELTPYTQ